MVHMRGTIGGQDFCWDTKEFEGSRKVADKIARKTRYRSGSRVFSCDCGSGKFVNDCCGVRQFEEMWPDSVPFNSTPIETGAIRY
jgi:hypothetical protein